MLDADAKGQEKPRDSVRTSTSSQYTDEKTKENDKDSLPNADPWFKVQLSDLIQILIASVMLVSVICSSRSIQIQEKALHNVNELTAAQIRPFVFSTALDMPIRLKADGMFSVWYKMENCGETPAFNLMAASRLTNNSAFPDLSFEVDEHDRALIGSSEFATALYPNEEIALISNEYNLAVHNSEGEIPVTLELLGQNWPYFMHIEIRYTDQFGKEYCSKSTYQSITLSENGLIEWIRLSVVPDL